MKNVVVNAYKNRFVNKEDNKLAWIKKGTEWTVPFFIVVVRPGSWQYINVVRHYLRKVVMASSYILTPGISRNPLAIAVLIAPSSITQ